MHVHCVPLGEPDSPASTALVLAESPARPSTSQHEGQALDIAATSGCLVDAGLMLGQSCRVGWAPNGTLVIPGQLAVTSILLHQMHCMAISLRPNGTLDHY